MKTAVVILNYNGRHFLEQFLPFVVQYTPNAEIIVVDNASTDDSVAFLTAHFPTLRRIINAHNAGFSAGYNLALRQVEADYYVLLNSDVEVTPHWLEPLTTLMTNNPQIAACQPKIKAFADKTKFEYAGAAGGMMDFLIYPFCRGRLFDDVETDTGQYDDEKEIFWATGACMLIRADLYHQFGGLDDDFFAHLEEIDLCWRLKNANYKIYYSGKSEVFHVGGGTLKKSNPFKTFLNFRNRLAMTLKNAPLSVVFPLLFVQLCLDGLSGLLFLLKGQPKNTWAIGRAHLYLYQNFFKIWKKRQATPPKKRALSHPEIIKKSIVWQYFVLKKKTSNL